SPTTRGRRCTPPRRRRGSSGTGRSGPGRAPRSPARCPRPNWSPASAARWNRRWPTGDPRDPAPARRRREDCIAPARVAHTHPSAPATDFEPASSVVYDPGDGLHGACAFHTHPPRSPPMREEDDRPIGRTNAVVSGKPRLIPWIWEGVVVAGGVTLLSAPEKV